MPTTNNHQQIIDNALYKAQLICHDNNIKLTTIRKDILLIIWQAKNYIKAYDILKQYQKIKPHITQVTVYRALDFLTKFQLIHKLQSTNSYIGCHAPLSYHQCYFIICNQCGIVTEFNDTEIEKSIIQHIKKQKTELININLELTGICQECKK